MSIVKRTVLCPLLVTLLFIFSTSASACPGDFDNSGAVDIADFLALVNVFGKSSSDAGFDMRMDFDSNGRVDIADFLVFVNVFGSTCEGTSNGGDDGGTFTLPGGASLEMVWIEPGTFQMGSPPSEPGRQNDEGPVHAVTISKGFGWASMR